MYLLFMGVVVNLIASFVNGQATSVLPPSLLGLPSDLWVLASPLIVAEAWIRWRLLSRNGKITGILPMEILWKLVP